MECPYTLKAELHQAKMPSSGWSGSSTASLSPTHPGSKLFLTLVLSCLILLEWTQGTVGSTSALLSTSETNSISQCLPRFGSDTTRAVLRCEGSSGVLTRSLHPDALPKLATLELGTGHPQHRHKSISNASHYSGVNPRQKPHITHNPVLVAVN